MVFKETSSNKYFKSPRHSLKRVPASENAHITPRKLARSVARHRFEKEGYTNINRHFSENWKKAFYKIEIVEG